MDECSNICRYMYMFECCSSLTQYIGRNGVLYSIRDDGDAIVRYGNNQIFQLNRQCLTKVTNDGSIRGWSVFGACWYSRFHTRLFAGEEN